MQGKELVQKLTRDFLVAVFFILSIAGVGFAASLLKLPSSVSLQNLGIAIGTVNVLSIVWLIFLFVALGGIALFWAKYASVFGKLVGLKAAQEPTPVKSRIRVLSLLVYGTIVSIIIIGINTFFNGLSQNIDITNFDSIKTALFAANIWSLIGIVIAFTFVGFAVIHLRKLYPLVEQYTPHTDTVKVL